MLQAPFKIKLPFGLDSVQVVSVNENPDPATVTVAPVAPEVGVRVI